MPKEIDNTPSEQNPNTIIIPKTNETSMPDIKGNSGATNDGNGTGIVDTPIFKGNGIDIPNKD